VELKPGMYVIVMGLAKSGEAAARLLHRYGVRVTVNEGKPLPEDDEVVVSLERLGIRVVSGHHPVELLDDAPDFIVKNPGIPYHVPFLEAARARNIPIYTEIELASWLTDSPIYAITGSNGKTTTTSLTGAIFRAADLSPVVAGNIGNVLSGVVSTVEPSQPIVLEVSSFQLLGTVSFHPRIGVLLNFYQAHLDYHGTFQAYMAAKWKLFANMKAEDTAVLNYDHELIRDGAASLQCDVRWFSTEGEVPCGIFVRDDVIVERRDGRDEPLFAVSEIRLKGKHNLENVLAAVLVARTANVSVDAIRRAVSEFEGVEHRSELVRTYLGVTYINDSKATNSEAALRALRAFPRHIVWIAGGLDRGDDFARLVDDLRQRLDAAILLGESAGALEKACQQAGVPIIQRVESLEEAVEQSARLAMPGATVLLSPACASWDMFRSFEERGSMFKSLVHKL
jgi:UDP-N-acetylmuramoylalanine--D-glutamate ligase